ncbi:MAG: OB-fold domain-containing protein [Pseudoxanthomonas sp.]|uniref:Zn-ribbon domain-containing OB-fold protein n=1 Tax=Hydrogenophaga sp. TaxID=1904254 RepID=UPI00271FA9DB|nr:OB-fold domain-containing protein [Hydrogenophaga sp.]MDO9504264.1 OB-fold domain-containing protein [Hydrogenophaga sp.]MDZ4047392.1 OB-fold domain-containing protein [Pseudoxanthomonas sp.]MDZ4283906.1 OB-fold domain-containing protein [Hydrogenophaga sp.]
MSRPLPRPTAETKPFWEGCAAGVVRYQCCPYCGTVQLVPRALCAACQSDALEWRDATGFGQVLSHTTVYRAPTPAFREDAPYVIALVDMEEGFRLMVNVAGGAAAPIAIGTRVRIGFRHVEGVALPHAEVCS